MSVTVESEVVAVTVYDDQAQVHREATVDLPEGDTTVVFDDIPDSVPRESIQVALGNAGASQCTLVGIAFDTVEPPADPAGVSEAREAARCELEELTDSLAAARDDLTSVEERRQTSTALFDAAVLPRKSDSPEALSGDTVVWKHLVEDRISEQAECVSHRRALEDKIEELEAAITKLKQQGVTLTSASPRSVVKVLLRADALAPGLVVRVSYIVREAKWSAVYDIRMSADRSAAEVSYHAVVEQSTVEVWPSVALTLSTAKPSISGKAPELSPWHVGLVAGAGSWGRSATIAQSASTTGATAMSFGVPGNKTVPNDGEAVRVTLTTVTLQPEVTYVSHPKLAECAFAELTATNPSDFALLPGPVSIFVGQQFVAKAHLPRVAPQEKFQVGLGTDEGITVKYKVLKAQRGDKGSVVTGKREQRVFERLIVLRSNKPHPVSVTVKDQVPLSGSTDIDVEVVDPRIVPDDAAANPSRGQDGVITWRALSLAPQQEMKVSVKFNVTFPRDRSVDGL